MIYILFYMNLMSGEAQFVEFSNKGSCESFRKTIQSLIKPTIVGEYISTTCIKKD